MVWAAWLVAVAGAALAAAPACGAEQAPPPPVGHKFVQLDVLDHEQYRELQEKRLGRSALFVLGPRPPPAPLGGDRETQCPDKQESTSVSKSSAASLGHYGDCAPQPDMVSAHCRSCVVQSQPAQQGGVLLTCADCQHRHPTRTCALGGRSNRFEPMYRVAADAFMVYEVERKVPETAAVAIREVMPREEEDKAVKPEHLEVDDTDDVLVDHQLEAPARDNY